MQVPLQITFRHLAPSPSFEARARESVASLQRFSSRILACHIVIDVPAAHRNKGAPFSIKIDLMMPGRNLCVDTARGDSPAHRNAYAALHDAFEALKRQLHDFGKQRQTARRPRPSAHSVQQPTQRTDLHLGDTAEAGRSYVEEVLDTDLRTQ